MFARMLCLLAALTLGGCGIGDGKRGGDQTLHVLAAASLADTFDQFAELFSEQHPDVRLESVYDSSGALVAALAEGAPADLIATADSQTMQRAQSSNVVTDPETFAWNTAVLITPERNPAGVTSFADLARDGVDFVVCVDTAPCGGIAADLLAANGIRREPASLEDNVRAVLERVTSEEADAGIVYATDALRAGDAVQVLDIPGSSDAVTSYQIAVVRQAQNPKLAQQFIDLVLSEEGSRLLAKAGFLSASPEPGAR